MPPRRRLRQRPSKVESTCSSEDDDNTISLLSSDSSEEEKPIGKTRKRQVKKPRVNAPTISFPKRSKHHKPLSSSYSSDEESTFPAISCQEDHENQQQWECTKCTYLNTATSSACDICLFPHTKTKSTKKKPKIAQISTWLTASKAINTATNPSIPIENIDSDSDKEPVLLRSSPTPLSSPQQLWCDAYHPQTASDLCVHKKKVDEVRHWLDFHAFSSPSSSSHRVLFLCGPSGAGKSATLRCLAQERGVTIKEWQDTSGIGRVAYHSMLKEASFTQISSSFDDFAEFLKVSTTYQTLPLMQTGSIRRRRRRKDRNGAEISKNELVLIENWPLVTKEDALERFHSLLLEVLKPFDLRSALVPVVIVFSEGKESKTSMKQLQRVFSEALVTSPVTSIINFNPIPTGAMKKTLARIVSEVKSPLKPHDLVEIAEQSGGDVRHAINRLQCRHFQPMKTPKNKEIITKTASSKTHTRDPFHSDLRVIGKLLHAKKEPVQSEMDQSEAMNRLEHVMSCAEMEMEPILAFVHENCVAFYSEIEELAQGMQLLSYCDVLLSESYRGIPSNENIKRAKELSSAVVVRLMAQSNSTPAKSAFRPIVKPKSYAVAATKRQKSQQLRNLTVSFGTTAEKEPVATPFRVSSDVLAFEILPFVDHMQWQTKEPVRNDFIGQKEKVEKAQETADEIEESDQEIVEPNKKSQCTDSNTVR